MPRRTLTHVPIPKYATCGVHVALVHVALVHVALVQGFLRFECSPSMCWVAILRHEVCEVIIDPLFFYGQNENEGVSCAEGDHLKYGSTSL